LKFNLKEKTILTVSDDFYEKFNQSHIIAYYLHTLGLKTF